MKSYNKCFDFQGGERNDLAFERFDRCIQANILTSSIGSANYKVVPGFDRSRTSHWLEAMRFVEHCQDKGPYVPVPANEIAKFVSFG